MIGSYPPAVYLSRAQVKSHGKHELWSRETLLLGNNILLVAGLLTVLLGTLLPLVHKELGLGSIPSAPLFQPHIYSWLIIPFLPCCWGWASVPLAPPGSRSLAAKVRMPALVLEPGCGSAVVQTCRGVQTLGCARYRPGV